MNDDLISREALLKAIEEERQYLLARGQRGAEHILVHHCLPLIDNAPTVEITEEQAIDKLHETGWMQRHDKEMTEQPTGEWIDEGQYAEGHSEHAFICKKCGYQIIVNPNMIFEERFCKYCGAKMKNTESEEKNMKEMTPKCTGEFHDPFSKMLNEAGKREFIKIVSRYVPDEICPYEEYKGKPYYSILYRENGEEFGGYSTYSLDILSVFLKCYFFGNGEEVVGNGLYNLDTSSEREETKMMNTEMSHKLADEIKEKVNLLAELIKKYGVKGGEGE